MAITEAVKEDILFKIFS